MAGKAKANSRFYKVDQLICTELRNFIDSRFWKIAKEPPGPFPGEARR